MTAAKKKQRKLYVVEIDFGFGFSPWRMYERRGNANETLSTYRRQHETIPSRITVFTEQPRTRKAKR